MKLLRLFLIALSLCSGCRCGPQVQPVEPARLVVTPEAIVLGAVYVGQVATGVVSVVNEGGATAEPEVSVSAPFEASMGGLRLVRGESATISVSFAPLTPGRVSGVLRVGAVEVPLEASALEVPECRPTTVCSEARFDPVGALCVQTPRPDGTSCETSCVRGGCSEATCVGSLKGCDDANACTVDACDETAGCSHAVRVCPRPTAPCQVARCDSATGCATEQAVDGTLCGPDDCLATQVDVCIAGTCVQRSRPATGRCANRWVPTTLPARRHSSMAYDAARQRVILFGGWGVSDMFSDTWEWDGSTWTQRTPAQSPPGRTLYAMAYDAARQRIVLFGGYDGSAKLADTWEWDGLTWVQRSPANSPPARANHAMTYDAARQRVVLFGGEAGGARSGTALADTWEWDGRNWTQRNPGTSPPARFLHAIAYDEVRRRVVLFGGSLGISGPFLSDTWEWDGSTWTRRTPNTFPDARRGVAMTFDVARQRLVLFGGQDDMTARGDMWEWDGSTWTERTPSTLPPALSDHTMAYDSARQKVVVLGGRAFDTWEWDGTTWSSSNRPPSPPFRFDFAMANDTARQRIVLWGGNGNGFYLSDTWEWDGSTWARLNPATSPPARARHAMAYDAARRRVVLFGGMDSALLADTWEWDGRTWTQRAPATSPPARERHVMAYDVASQRVVLFGGEDAIGRSRNDTWEWDGTTWTLRAPVTAPPITFGRAMATDDARQRLVLFVAPFSSDTWEWDGTTWAERPAVTTSPPPRSAPAMGYDEARQRVVLFGGQGNTLLSDTWEWDGTRWTELRPVVSPPSGFGRALAFDSVRRRMVLFTDSDTWVLLP